MIKSYISLIKFSHTVFALPFALIGFFLAISYAGQLFFWEDLIYVILCMIFARNSAMAFNRYIDREIDTANPRTAKIREIPNGRIDANSALIFVLINSLLFVLSAYFLNWICLALSPIALVIILGYSFTKRFTSLCHFILGLGLSLSPIGAYLAVTGEFELLPLLFSSVVLFWVSGFDIIYALQDEKFDKEYHLHSIPVLLGKRNALKLSRALHLVTSFIIIGIGIKYFPLSPLYNIASLVFIGLLINQHILIKKNDLSKINMTFFTNNGIASIVFAFLVITDLLV
jgi:4-hydroxybenzoate polyprenyltransferase